MMFGTEIHLSSGEWSVMECLWEESPLMGRDVTERLEKRMGWNRSTTLTLLRRLEEKGAVASDAQGGKKQFRPMIRREDAALQEAESFLSRVYHGSLTLMIHAMTKRQQLSQEEIDELQTMLNQLKGDDRNA